MSTLSANYTGLTENSLSFHMGTLRLRDRKKMSWSSDQYMAKPGSRSGSPTSNSMLILLRNFFFFFSKVTKNPAKLPWKHPLLSPDVDRRQGRSWWLHGLHRQSNVSTQPLNTSDNSPNCAKKEWLVLLHAPTHLSRDSPSAGDHQASTSTCQVAPLPLVNI